jgi:hypothetical protein
MERSRKIIEQRDAVKRRNCDLRIELAQPQASGKFLFSILSPEDIGSCETTDDNRIDSTGGISDIVPRETHFPPRPDGHLFLVRRRRLELCRKRGFPEKTHDCH